MPKTVRDDLSAMGERRDADGAALSENRQFLKLLAAQTLTNAGSSMTAIVLPLLVLDRTGSPFLVTLAAACQALPYFLLGLPAGAMIDKADRKRVLQTCEAICFLTTGLLAISLARGFFSVGLIYAVSLINGCCYAFHSIAEVSSLTSIVAKPDLPRANGVVYGALSIATIAGTSLGGLVYGAYGASAVFALDAATFLGSAVLLGLIEGRLQSLAAGPSPSRAPLLDDVKTGFRGILSHPLIAHSLLIIVMTNLIGAAYFNYAVVFGRDDLLLSPKVLGLVMGVATLGGVLGAYLAPKALARMAYARLMTILLAGEVLTRLAFPFSPNALVFLLLDGVLNVSQAIINIAVISTRQAQVPDAILGRVNSVFRTSVFATRPVAQIAAGALMSTLGAKRALILSGALFTVPATYALWKLDASEGSSHAA